MDAPKLVGVEQVCDGWVKKHLLTYQMPDGSLYEYHCATRRSAEEYRAELERNAVVSEAASAAKGLCSWPDAPRQEEISRVSRAGETRSTARSLAQAPCR